MNQENNTYIFNFWWAANYGANLTAYAINKLFDGSSLINNQEFVQKIVESKHSFHTNFAKKYLKTTDKSELYGNKTRNTLITGSDQVFRPCLNKKISSDYFLDFAPINSKKIAFSASFGVNKEIFLKENSSEDIERMKQSLKSFDLISVREKTGTEICKDIFNVEAEWIIDPVFILDKTNYEELIKNSTKDYSGKIVSYMINSHIDNYNGEKTTELFASNEPIENWLNAIKTCKLFITNSFHGVCFAIIFNKPFICIVNSETGSTRYDSLFEMLGIENQIIKTVNDIRGNENIFKIDYSRVNKRINEESQRGLDFLSKVLETPVSKTQEKIDAEMRYLEKRVCELEEQNNLSYQLKKYLWEKWLIIYHCYLPMPVKKCISFIWHIIKGVKNARRK